MSTEPSDFDLKFLPDWLKEPPKKNAYADYEGERPERPGRDFSRPGGGRGRESRGRDKRQGDDRNRPKPQRDQRDQRGADRNRPRETQAPAPQPAQPPVVNVEFLPEPNCTAALAKQIKSSSRAYPLFDLARMFLEKPDRHRVKITTLDGKAGLHQCGEGGPVSLDRQSIERNAFTLCKQDYYAEETTQGEPPKGNYTNVARCSLSGTWLGPTNHHAYQPTLRKLYEERFSRRMPFAEYQRNIEVVNTPEAVEAWKEQARSVTTFKTLKEPEPVTFTSVSEAEQHFRTHYLEKSVRSGNAFEMSGEASRALQDRNIMAAVRRSWEDENRFPGHLMNHLRREFIHAGLYIFKHRNRVQLVSVIRPTPFNEKQQTLSETVIGILKAIDETPKCTRAALAAKVLKGDADESGKLKSALVSDLHWLTHAGHVIEMHNGILELPSIAKKGDEKPAKAKTEPKAEAQKPESAAKPEPENIDVPKTTDVTTPDAAGDGITQEEPAAIASPAVAPQPAPPEEPAQPAADLTQPEPEPSQTPTTPEA